MKLNDLAQNVEFKSTKFSKGDICMYSLTDNNATFSKAGLLGKTRPCIIVSDFDPSVTKDRIRKIIPIRTAEWYEEANEIQKSCLIPIMLEHQSYIDVLQERPISDSRIISYVGTITNFDEVLKQIQEVHDKILGIKRPEPEIIEVTVEKEVIKEIEVPVEDPNTLKVPENLLSIKDELQEYLYKMSRERTEIKNRLENKNKEIEAIKEPEIKDINIENMEPITVCIKGRFSKWDRDKACEFIDLCRREKSYPKIKDRLVSDFNIKTYTTFTKARKYWANQLKAKI